MILISKPSKDYELIDSGEGEKLERFGDIVLSRPDPQALWKKKLDENEWKKAQGHFLREGKDGKWNMKKGIPDEWNIDFGEMRFKIKPTPFKHVGIFPEQFANWSWMSDIIKKNTKNNIEKKSNEPSKQIEVLNLFGYTGGATLTSAQVGAKVVHVDSSKSAIAWARKNADLSQLSDKPIRWIEDDARTFVKKEIKRGRKYDAIIMDPPAFGHGAGKELWKIEDDFLALIENCLNILSDKPIFFIINGYSAGYSHIAYRNNLEFLKKKYGGNIESGELSIEEGVRGNGNNKENSRLLPCGIFARWHMK